MLKDVLNLIDWEANLMDKLVYRDLHHISWKNHGIDGYIKKALVNYLKKSRSVSHG